MVSEEAVHAVETIQSVPRDDQPSVTIDLEQANDRCRVATSEATSDSNDGVDAAKDKVLVHYGHFCDGDACNQPHFPIIGTRHECLSCKQAKYQHNLCDACHHRYPFKSENKDSTVSPIRDCIKSLASSSVKDKKPGEKIVNVDDDGNKNVGTNGRHVFKSIAAPRKNGWHSERLVDVRLIDTKVSEKRIKTKMDLHTDFDTMTFVIQVLVLYPLAFLVYILHPNMLMPIGEDGTSDILNFVFEVIHNRYHYFERLPMVQIGLCWVLNILAMVLVCVYTGPNGNVMTAYWIFVYEVFFMQSVIAQTQLHLAGEECGAVKFAFLTMTGWSTRNLGETLSISKDDILPFVNRQRSIKPPKGGGMDSSFKCLLHRVANHQTATKISLHCYYLQWILLKRYWLAQEHGLITRAKH